MEKTLLHAPRVYVMAALLAGLAALGTWAAVGSPSAITLIWVAVVGTGLVIATALAVRDGSPTRSVTHILHDAEQQPGDRNVPRVAVPGAKR